MRKEQSLLPMQPYLIMNTDDFKRIDVNANGIAYFYRYSVRKGTGKLFQAVPDGSTDLLFGIGSHGVNTYIGGTVLKLKEWQMEENRTYFGVSFLPGQALFPKGITVADVVDDDLQIDNQDLAGNLAERIAQENDFIRQAEFFYSYYQQLRIKKLGADYSAKEIEKYIRNRIYEKLGNITVKELAKESGYSECYIRRCFETVHGISPKTFGKFVRFQSVLQSVHQHIDNAKMEQISIDCGYYDQSHMMKDFKSFTGMTPEVYRKTMRERTMRRIKGWNYQE